jgi:hypothetical protein
MCQVGSWLCNKYPIGEGHLELLPVGDRDIVEIFFPRSTLHDAAERRGMPDFRSLLKAFQQVGCLRRKAAI